MTVEDSSNSLGCSLQLVRGQLELGEVVAFPTETVFGLGIDPRSERAASQLLGLKSRQINEGIPCIAASIDEVSRWVDALQLEACRELTGQFWPGPLTLVFTAGDRAIREFATGIMGADNSIAIRISSHPGATELSRSLGCLLPATSANPHGLPPARSASECKGYFPRIFVLEGACSPQGLPSTILDIRSQPFRLIREGGVSSEALKAWL